MVATSKRLEERFIQLENVRARYLEAGQGTPTIFLHGVGFATGADTWIPCVEVGLADRLHVIALDMIGWGQGDRPSFEYSLSYFADHIREVQDALGFAKTNIVGHSLGGWQAALFAYESPERVNKLVLVANAGMNVNPPPGLSGVSVPTRETIRQQLSETLGLPDLLDMMTDERTKNANAPGAVEAYEQIDHHIHNYDMRRRYYLKRRLSKLRMPTMVIYGGEDQGFPVPMGQDIAARIPGARFEVVAGSGHMIPIEKPRELTALLQDFLD